MVAAGSVIAGRYEVLECLGRGGMGVVYKAHDRILDEAVALKILRMDLGDKDDMTRRFRSEIKLARRVTHSNVCRIHEYGEDGRLQYISMELIEGTDLKKLIRERGPLPIGEAYDVAIQIADGLQAIHKLGIIHRDLKTPNIMRDAQGVVRLMDFGIAKRFDSMTMAGTLSGHIVGTPEYMSPEQARGDKVDHRSDLYAVGIVIFEIFSGDVPFRGETPIATIFQHIEKPPPLEGDRARRIPAALAPTLRRALAKSPADRHASAEELAQELRQQRAAVIAAGAERTLVLPATEPQMEAPRRPRRPVTPPPRTDVASAATEIHQPVAGPPATGRRLVRRSAIGLAITIALAAVAGLVLQRRSADEPPPIVAGATPTPPVAAPTVPAATPTPFTATTLPPPPPATTTPARPTPVPATPVPATMPTPRPAPTDRPAPRASPPPPRPASPAVVVAVSPSPSPTAAPSAAPRTGILRLLVLPYAEVRIEGKVLGTTPMKPVELEAGAYTVWFTHPDYQPLQRRVVIRPGEATEIELDLRRAAFPR
jgi:predicted Ser/Thr protein kinase